MNRSMCASIQVMIGLERYRRLMTVHQERGPEIVNEHEQLLAAIRAGDANEAAKAARLHTVHARTLYRQILSSR